MYLTKGYLIAHTNLFVTCSAILILLVMYTLFKRRISFSSAARADSGVVVGREKKILSIEEQLKKIKPLEDSKTSANELGYSIADLIDLKQLESIQDNISKALGVACITVDINGSPVTKASGFTDFCMKYTRGSNEGLKCCTKCDVGGGALSAKTNRPAVYRCHAGLVDFGVPILIDGVQIGSILGGQVLTSSPDEASFAKIASKFKINKSDYLAALNKIPIVSADKVEAAAEVLFSIANTLSQLGHSRLKSLDKASALTSRSTVLVDSTVSKTNAIVNQVNSLRSVIQSQAILVEDFSTTIEQMMMSIKAISEVADAKNTSSRELLVLVADGESAISSTNKAILDMIGNSEKIVDFIDVLNNINVKTNLLAINASIEAAHAGERGNGFSVVAGELKNLADDAMSSTSKIDSFLKDNSSLTKELIHVSSDSESSYGKIETEIEEVLNSLEGITHSTIKISSGTKDIMRGVSDLRDITTSVSESSANIEEMITTINGAMSEIKTMTNDFVSALD